MLVQSFKSGLLGWQIGGFIFLVAGGSLLHFVYAWSGYATVVGLISPVNESVWEHLKLGFWALVLWSLLEFWFIRGTVNNYLLAKAVGMVCLQGFILIFFYSYTALTGHSILVLDIGSYVAGCLLCQLVSFRLLRAAPAGRAAALAAALVIALHAASLIVFTFRPPRLPLFRDGPTGRYGLEVHAADHRSSAP
jgi:hypothetical protein